MRVVAHHGAEHHLVVGALRAADAAGHPGVHEDSRAFQIPARRVHARGGEVVVEDRFRMFLDRRGLAHEEFAPERILIVPHVHRGDVDEFVVHQREDALAGSQRLERLVHGGDVDQKRVVRRRARGGVAVVGEVLEQNRDLLPRLPFEDALLEFERVQRRTRHVRREVGFRRIEIEDVDVLRFDTIEFDFIGAGKAAQRAQQQQAQQRRAHELPRIT